MQSGVLVVLMGDTNQHLSSKGTVNLFNAYPVAHKADAFSLLLSFRFGAESAPAYNAALIPREPGQTIQPLMCGFGPPVSTAPSGGRWRLRETRTSSQTARTWERLRRRWSLAC